MKCLSVFKTPDSLPNFTVPPRPSWLVVILLMASLFVSVNSHAAAELYIEGADLEATTSLDMWHHSGGYWKVGNAGSEKIIVDDEEIEDRGYASILASEHAEFQIPLSRTVRQKIADGKQIACRVEGRSAALDELFEPASVEFDFTATTLYFRAKPIFNLIAKPKLSFTDYNLSPAREIPLIDRAFGYNIYSLFGNGESGAQAAGRVNVAQPYTIESGYVHPSMITNLAGHLAPGHIIYIRGNPVDSAGYRVGDGTFAAGGAVGLSFSFPVRFKFYEVIEGSVPGDPEDPEEPPEFDDVTVTAQLDLPPSTYEGHSVFATDASLFEKEGETFSATRAYAEGLASNRFSIVESGAGSISRRSSVRAEAVFPESGRYHARLKVDTQSGHAGEDTKPIDVLKTPAITHSLTGTQKQNRKQVLNFQIAKRPTETLADVWVKLEYLDEGEWVTLHHELLGGNALQNSDTIKTRPIERLPASDEYFERCRLEFLLKNDEPANCRYTIYAEDSRGEWDRVTTDFSVSPDRPPEAKILLDAEFVRGEGSNVAEVEVEDATTTDGDQVDRLWFYRELEAEGQTAAGPWIPINAAFPGYEDRSFGTGKTIAFSKTGVGRFEVGLIVKDRWTEETLEEYVTDGDRLQSSTAEMSDVANIAPVVSMEPVRTQTAGITILAGGAQEYLAARDNRARLERELLQEGIDAAVTIERMEPQASENVRPGAVRTASIETPFGYEGNWLFYESDNYLADEAHLYKMDATWAGSSSGDLPGAPYTISCWAFDAAGTPDTKWTCTFGDETMSVPLTRTGPCLAQDDAGRYLFFTAGGRTLLLSKDTGAALAVLDTEVGRYNFVHGERIYSFLPDGIVRISAVTGTIQKIYDAPIVAGEQRRLQNRVHFVTGTSDDFKRGLFDLGREEVSFETLYVQDPVYGIPNHKVLAIDCDGRVVMHTESRGRNDSGSSAGELYYYYARTHAYGRDNRLLFATPAKQDSTTYPYTAAPVLDEGGACTHIAHTWNSRSSSARYGYAQVYRLCDGATLTGQVKGGKDDYPTASSKILFARDIAGQVYVTNGAEWVYVWNAGYNIYQERVKTFVFDMDADTVRSGNLYGELGISLSTFESGVVSDAIAVVQAGYNTPGNAYSRNDIMQWDQTLPMILKRYADKGFRGEHDIDVFVVCDETNPASLYTESVTAELAARIEAQNGQLLLVGVDDIEGDTLRDLIARPVARERRMLLATVQAGSEARLSKSYKLEPGRTYYYEYDIQLSAGEQAEDNPGGTPTVDPANILTVTHDIQPTPGAMFGDIIFRTVASYEEDFSDAARVNPFFRFNREPLARSTGTNLLVHEGYYKGADLLISANSNVYRSDPYPLDATALRFTVPAGCRAFLSFDYLMQKEAEHYGAQRWLQSYVKIDDKLWSEYNVAGGRGHYSHPELLEAGEHVLTFFASHYGRKEQAKMWLESIRVDIVETVDLNVQAESGLDPLQGAVLNDTGNDSGSGAERFTFHQETQEHGVPLSDFSPQMQTLGTMPLGSLQADLENVSVRPLGDGFMRISGSFETLPKIPYYGEVQNAIVIDGAIDEVPHVTVTNSTSENFAFQLDVPPDYVAIFTQIPTTSYSYNEQAVSYSVPMFTYRSDGKTYWATDAWVFRPKIKNAQENMFAWPADGVITAGILYEPKIFSLQASAYRYAFGAMDGVTSVMVDAENEGWHDRNFFLTFEGGETRYLLEGGSYEGAEFAFNLPEGMHKIRDLKVYSTEDGLRRYAADERFSDPLALSSWCADGGEAAVVHTPVPIQEEPASLVYRKGERVAYDIHYYDYEGDPSKRQFWRYTHTPFNDGSHPDAALILDEYGEPAMATGTVLSAPIERFYIDGKYTVEHWQEDNTARPPTEEGNPAYDKPSNVVSITFYVEGGGQAPWIKSIKTIPHKVKEGETYLIEVEVDDAEGDVLSLVTELYKEGQRIYVHRKEGIERVDGRYAPVRTGTAPVAVAGTFEIVCTVRDATGAGLGSYRFEVQSEGGIEGAVDHTDTWDENRREFNLRNFGEQFDGIVSLADYLAMPMPGKRGYNVFWPGERLCLGAQAQGAPASVRAYPRGRPELACDLAVAGLQSPSGHTSYEGTVNSAALWAPGAYSQPVEIVIRFVATYPGGIEKTSDVPIIVCGRASYWQLHRLY